MLDGDGVGAVELAERSPTGTASWPGRTWPSWPRSTSGRRCSGCTRSAATTPVAISTSGAASPPTPGSAGSTRTTRGTRRRSRCDDGRLDDAAAEYDAAMEALAQDDRGWSSTLRGDARPPPPRRGRDRPSRRRASPRSAGSGNPTRSAWPTSISPTPRSPRPSTTARAAARLAARSWRRAVDEHNVLWMLLAGVDHLRLADDDATAAEIVAALADLRHVAGSGAGPRRRRSPGPGAPATSTRRAMPPSTCRAIASRYDAARMLGDVAELAADGGDPSTARQVLAEAVDRARRAGRGGRCPGAHRAPAHPRHPPRGAWPARPAEGRLGVADADGDAHRHAGRRGRHRTADRSHPVHLAAHRADPRVPCARQARPHHPPRARGGLRPKEFSVS